MAAFETTLKDLVETLNVICWFREREYSLWNSCKYVNHSIFYEERCLRRWTKHDFVYRTSQPKVLHKKCSEKTCKIHRKLPAIVYLFSRMAGLQPANLLPQEHHRWNFSVNIIIFLRVVSLENTCNNSLCVFVCLCVCVCGVYACAHARVFGKTFNAWPEFAN